MRNMAKIRLIGVINERCWSDSTRDLSEKCVQCWNLPQVNNNQVLSPARGIGTVTPGARSGAWGYRYCLPCGARPAVSRIMKSGIGLRPLESRITCIDLRFSNLESRVSICRPLPLTAHCLPLTAQISTSSIWAF